MTSLFEAAGYRAFEIGEGDLPALQRFYRENPEYHRIVTGRDPGTDAARGTFDSRPPAGWPFTRKWLLGFTRPAEPLVGMADIIEDLHAKNVWHIGLFVVATARHGDGTAPALYRGLERWMRAGGAQWSRLGVVAGNARAERFWEKMGYVEVRRRHGVVMVDCVNTLRILVKPLAGGRIAEYLARVPRDREDA